MHHASKDKHGQAALEFLMTYGWAFLVMAAVIAGFTVFNPLGSTAEASLCSTTSASLSCDERRVRAGTDALEVSLENKDTESLGISDIQVSSVNGENTSYECQAQDSQIGSGDAVTVTCDNASLVQGQVNDVELTYQRYDAQVGETYANTGTAMVRVEPRGDINLDTYTTAPSNPADVLQDMDGDGSTDDPYVVTDIRELQAMNADTSAHYTVAQDIDASGTTEWNNGSGFKPIGRPGFTGSFDGSHHTITGLFINRTGNDIIGLFGHPTNADLANISVQNADVAGKQYVGGFLGHADASTIDDIRVSGQVEATQNTAGGLAGVFEGAGGTTVNHSVSTATVNTSSYGGGLVGYTAETGQVVSHSYATGRIECGSLCGGLVGYEYNGLITKSWAAADLAGCGSYCGGITGYARGDIQTSYWDTDVHSTGSSDATGLPTNNMTGASAKGNMSGLDFDDMWQTTNGYPELR